MKNAILSLVLICFAIPTFAAAKNKNLSSSTSVTSSHKKFGLGVVLGDPVAITGKVWLNSTTAADVGVAYYSDRFFLIYTDYLLHFPGAFKTSNRFFSELSPYVGVGGMLLFFSSGYYHDGEYYRNSGSSQLGLAARIPLGIEWLPTNAPHLGVFVEVVPGVSVIPGTSGFFLAGIGARYYFD
jgi:hypothetical protein